MAAGVMLQSRRIEHDGDIKGFPIVILRKCNEMLDPLLIEITRILFAQPRRKVINNDRLIGISDLPQKTADEFRAKRSRCVHGLNSRWQSGMTE